MRKNKVGVLRSEVGMLGVRFTARITTTSVVVVNSVLRVCGARRETRPVMLGRCAEWWTNVATHKRQGEMESED